MKRARERPNGLAFGLVIAGALLIEHPIGMALIVAAVIVAVI